MDDLLIQVSREQKIYANKLVTLQEGETIVFGREIADNPDVIGLRTSEASRHHFQIVMRNKRYWIEDCSSKNGTFVDGQKIDKPVVISPAGAIIQPGTGSKAQVTVTMLRLDNEGLEGETFLTTQTKTAEEENKDSPEWSLEINEEKDNGTRKEIWKTHNRKIQQLFHNAKNIAAAPFPLLLEGERGTGKGTLAQAIHHLSGKNDFVYVNAGQLNSEVGWNTFVGHLTGAFTGARENREGFLSTKLEGTLFLDEIDTLSDAVQGMLLTTFNSLDQGTVKYYKNGCTEMEEANLRLITATTANLKSGNFRLELFDRIACIHLVIPPLRERIADDLEFLLEFTFAKLKHDVDWDIQITADGKAQLLQYEYPGNVRDFHNIVIRAATLSNNRCLTAKSVGEAIESMRQSGTEPEPHMANKTISRRQSEGNSGLLESWERNAIIQCAKSGMSQAAAAKLIYGTSEDAATKNLKRHLQKYQLEYLWSKEKEPAPQARMKRKSSPKKA